jgi:deoxycytidylate deaminase
MNKLIEIAVEEAKKSTHKQKMGCVLFDKKIIVSKGYNHAQKSVKHLLPEYQRWPGSVHAEVETIRKAKKSVVGMSMLIVRINKENQFRTAKPCVHCMSYLRKVKIKRIYYSISEFPYLVELKLSSIFERI